MHCTGTSFQRVEDKDLVLAVIPFAQMQCCQTESPSKLDKAFNELKKKVNAYLHHGTVCLTTEGWRNIKNEPSIVNYMASLPLATVLLKSVLPGEQGYNAECIASDGWWSVAYPATTTTFAGAVKDNTSTNKNVWDQLSRKNPSAYFQASTSHGLNLFIKDVFGATKTKKARDAEPTSYPINYTFEELLEFIAMCKGIVKLFHNHHSLKAKVKNEQTKIGVKGLASLSCSFTLGNHQRMLQDTADVGEDFACCCNCTWLCQGDDIISEGWAQHIITRDNLVLQFKKSHAILKPIDALIVK